MPFIPVNGAEIYYEAFGSERPDRAPVVLIHGSTGTGHSNWSLVAPLLAREYRVIVPDCRGHGQSSNPHGSYSFQELAADTAGLIRALGYARAHVIGHSNGGNVALVTLLEHPDVVQTCIPQAANAYVSPDLVEKEPAIFDPDRVAREDPAWMEEMIALHGPTHGPDYWRELLRLTVHAIITEPNYTPADLAQVQRPTLVIQGANDRVNAPARHGEFIAEHIPYAELWVPAGVGHTVHGERLLEWVTRVLDFLARRGDDANETLYRLRQSRYADERETIFEVKAHPPTGDAATAGRQTVTGMVLTEEQRRAALAALRPVTGPLAETVQVLLTETTPWALVNRGVTDLRREPRTLAERLTQALLGEPVRILEERGEWARVRLERDGYLGWLQTAALHRCRASDAVLYGEASDALVSAELAPFYEAPSPTEPPAGKLPFGVSAPVVELRDEWSALALPDGRLRWVATADLLPLAARPQPDSAGIAFTLSLIRRFVGVPYLWGGRTPFGFDCSGLAQTFWGFLGIQLPRDADQQFRALPVEQEPPQPGDLLYFGDPADHSTRAAHVTHVAIALGGAEFIHANGAAWAVSYNSLDPGWPHYSAWLKEHLLGVRRPTR